MGVKILKGDCRDVLKTLPSESVHCVVTSPPYWGLRDYGTAKWEGGNPECDHLQVAGQRQDVGRVAVNGFHGSAKPSELAAKPYAGICSKCGARRIDSQIGLEPTFDAFIAEMVSVFREVRRVLRKDGTLWLNLGDSYARNGGEPGGGNRELMHLEGKQRRMSSIPDSSGLKPKDLCGIPWRVAFALQADGWWLRQDIIWAKPNPMPESVTDRCTKAHEYIFLLSKSARYYYDAEAIKEEAERAGDIPGGSYRYISDITGGHNRDGFEANCKKPVKETRNKRSVWEVATAPFSEGHFATFPPELIEPCIKAGCPKDGTVLDPFGGAGTTGLVADRLQRNAILIELNPQYAAMAEKRLFNDAPLFAQVAAE